MNAFEPNPRAVIGGNQPNFVPPALADIRHALKPFARRKREFLRAAAKVVIRDRADAGAAADLIGLARDVRNMVDAARKEIVDPHADAVKAVNGRTRTFWDDVDEAMRIVQAKLDEFARAEEKRIQEQRAEQEAEIARRRADIAPAAVESTPSPPPPAARQPKRRSFRGDYGRQAIVTDVDVIEIEDWRQLPDWVFQAADVQDAIRKVVRPMVKQKVEIPGLKVTRDVKTSTRK